MTKTEIIAGITTNAFAAKRLARMTKSQLERLLAEKSETSPSAPVQIGDEVVFASRGREHTGVVISVDPVPADRWVVRIDAPGFEIVWTETSEIVY